MRARAFTLTAVGFAALAAMATSASGAQTYCPQSGDVCLSLIDGTAKVTVQENLAVRYANTRTLCVKAPRRAAFCQSVPVRAAKGGGYAARLTVPRMTGVYRAGWDKTTWRVSLTVKSGHVTRTCKKVPHPAGASHVRAINMNCTAARSIVRRTAKNNGEPPAGWTFVNPAGCEGVIVRNGDVDWTANHRYRTPPGRPAISVVIFAGCNS